VASLGRVLPKFRRTRERARDDVSLRRRGTLHKRPGDPLQIAWPQRSARARRERPGSRLQRKGDSMKKVSRSLQSIDGGFRSDEKGYAGSARPAWTRGTRGVRKPAHRSSTWERRSARACASPRTAPRRRSPNDLGGYSVLQAESKEALAETLKGHPHFMMPDSTIEIVEFMQIPGM